MLPFNYRYYMYTDRRWVVTPNTPSTLNAVQSLGTGAEPNIDWDTKGIFIPAGTTINSFILAGSLNHSEIVDLDLRLYFQHGPWNSTWDNAAATTYATLYSADDANFVGSGGMRLQTYPCNYTAPADGYFLLAARASAASPLSTTRYFEAAGTLDVTLPPSV